MFDKIATIAASAMTVLLATTLVLPGRQGPALVREGGNATAKIANSLIGRG